MSTYQSFTKCLAILVMRNLDLVVNLRKMKYMFFWHLAWPPFLGSPFGSWPAGFSPVMISQPS
jgi:hypothetical protein